jgi:uncharacterized damage-inducible protein DinB
MNSTGYIGLVDTNRGELRERIALARGRFDRLVRTADPDARVPRSEWTVQQTVAHVLTVAHRYQGIARGTDYHRAGHPRELDAINQGELEAVMAPIPELADQLQDLAPEMDAYFDTHSDDEPTIPFHHAVGGGLAWQTNWLGELLFHGHDVARAVKTRWELPEREMALVLRGALQLAAAWLRRDIGAATDLCVAFEVHGARPYLIHVHDSRAEIRERRAEDRPDAVLKCSASVFAQLLYQRTGPLLATLRGLRIVGGRRPWLALRLQSYFERP